MKLLIISAGPGINEIRQEYGGNPIPNDTDILKKLHPTVLQEAEEKEQIGPDLFGGDNEAKATHNANIQKALKPKSY